VPTLAAEKDSSARVWQTVQTELSAALSSAQSADVYAIASLWEAPQETILRWRVASRGIAYRRVAHRRL
jgi:hypothetical protein